MAGKSKYIFNDMFFFEKIDTEEKAYFLGLIYADGSINNKLYTLQLNLIEEDKYLLDCLNNYIYKNRPLREINPRELNHKIQYQLTISSKKIYNDLNKLGIIQNKSIIGEWMIDNSVPSKLMNHFIRGYFDGNGCIYNNLKTKNKLVTFTGTTLFIEKLREFLVKNISLRKGNISNRNSSSLYNSTLVFGGNLQVERIKSYLYNNATIFMKRKKEKFNQIL